MSRFRTLWFTIALGTALVTATAGSASAARGGPSFVPVKLNSQPGVQICVPLDVAQMMETSGIGTLQGGDCS